MAKLLKLFVFIMIALSVHSCQLECGNYHLFERCSNVDIENKGFKDYVFDSFEFKAPKTWKFKISKDDDLTNYMLINELQKSIDENNIETFVITTIDVHEGYDFESEFEDFVENESNQLNQSVLGVETFKENDFDNKTGIYLEGTLNGDSLKYETLAICILKNETIYWLNCTTNSESKMDLNLCTSKLIASTFKTK